MWFDSLLKRRRICVVYLYGIFTKIPQVFLGTTDFLDEEDFSAEDVRYGQH